MNKQRTMKEMPYEVCYLIPGSGEQYRCGGLSVITKTASLSMQFQATQILTYRENDLRYRSLDEYLKDENLAKNALFVLGWGPDFRMLSERLKGHRFFYYAHSTGYPFKLKPRRPVVCVSRYTLGTVASEHHQAPMFYLPNCIDDCYQDIGSVRDIDVLVIMRKASSYLKKLLGQLPQTLKVHLITDWVEAIYPYFQRSRLYLYDSTEYWSEHQLTEGFGMQPLEAMACGAEVFTSVNHGLSDYIDPAYHGQIMTGNLTYDTTKIVQTLTKGGESFRPIIESYRTHQFIDKLKCIYKHLYDFYQITDTL